MFILIGIPGENYRPVVSHWQPYHIMLYRLSVIRTHNVSILEIYAINKISQDFIDNTQTHKCVT
jgi:hypothetical protein